jgi:capsular polysaccharide transport system permease protein
VPGAAEGGGLTPQLPLRQSPRRQRSAWEVQRSVIFALVLREMMARVGGQWIGALWTVVEPLAHVMFMVTYLGFLRGTLLPGIEYPVFLAAGLIPFFFFQKLVTRLIDGIEANRGLLAYRQVKPIDTLVARGIVETLMNLVVYGITLAILGWLGLHVLPAQPLEMLGINLMTCLLGLSMGVLFAVVCNNRPRLRSVMRLIFVPLYVISGVIVNVHTLPRELLDWLLWNPVLHVVELSRHTFIAGYPIVDGVTLFYPLAWTLVCAALALSLYRVNRLQLLASV